MADPTQITDDLRKTFRGRLAFDSTSRGIYSTDASPFQVAPLGVAIPIDADDLSVLVRYAFDHAIPLIARGAGTGVAGESLGPGLVVDLSVHFRRILRQTTDTVTVEPGVGLDQLNEALAASGRRFAPNPASGASCTVGGMVATNASGGNAFRYGYTRDYVAGLNVVWDNGEQAALAGTQPATPIPTSLPPGGETLGEFGSEHRTADIQAATTTLLRANRELIDRARPLTAFNRCGYLLQDLLTANGPDIAKLLCGSEGTLAFLTTATLRTIPLAGGAAIALVGFATVDAAVRAALDLREFCPVECDLLDRRLLTVTRAPRAGQSVGLIPPSIGAALVMTFEEDTERDAASRAVAALERLREAHRLAVLVEPTCDPEGMARVRGARSLAVSGLYGLGRGPRPVAFVEDIGVPPEVIPEFLAQIQDILKRFELTASFLVHPMTGQVHTRPLVDLNDPTDRAKMWPLAEKAHDLALSLGGTVSAQHGTGIARTPWVEKQYGPLLPVFRELKRIFDPKGLLNPGKIIGPDPSRPAWPLREQGPAPLTATSTASPTGTEILPPLGVTPAPVVPAPDTRTPILIWADSAPLTEATKCTGCGDCRSTTAPSRMCPVFRATMREESSPRAKANVIRLLGSPLEAATAEVQAITAGCVNCRMCREECPSRVDVSKLVLEARAARHAAHGLERADWIFARAEALAPFGSNFAPLVNGLLARPSVRWLVEKLFGVSRSRRLPAFAAQTFFRRAKSREGAREGVRGKGLGVREEDARQTGSGSPLTPYPLPLTPGASLTPPEPRAPKKVAYFIDTFANYNDPLIGEATVAVLRHNGIEVYLPPRQVGCGMASLAEGDTDAAREAAQQNVRALVNHVREGYRVVCSEPTAALMLTHDYPTLLDDPDTAIVAANTVELTTYLWELHTAGRLKTDFRRLDMTLGHHVPCHQKALRGPVAGPSLLNLIPGVIARTIDVSCSGMGGLWGLRAENVANSLAAGRRMLDELDRPGTLFGSTECSACRLQMQEGTGKRALHPVQYLAYAYGLLPEVGPKLRRPLGALVSD